VRGAERERRETKRNGDHQILRGRRAAANGERMKGVPNQAIVSGSSIGKSLVGGNVKESETARKKKTPGREERGKPVLGGKLESVVISPAEQKAISAARKNIIG